VLDIDPAGAGISVHISGVFLRGGIANGGGVIRNHGTLVVTDSAIVNPSPNAAGVEGGGILSLGSLRIERSVISHNGLGTSLVGGGIRALGSLEVIDSTIAANSAGNGGGISAVGPVILVRSTLSGNTASTGGGLAADNATLVNSTVSGNTGGGLVAGGTVELSNVTITKNVGSGVTAGSLVLRNTIVGRNIPADCVVASTTGDAYNIDGDGSCGLSGSDQPSTAPLLGPLADNGGPTFTHALLAGSPAIDMGSPAAPCSGGTACEATDQRGVTRPDGSRCDVGAFEGIGTTTPSTTSSTTTTNTLTTSTTTSSTATTTIPPNCPSLPRSDCQPALGERSRLALKSVGADHTKDKLSWGWVGSAPVPVAAFADPVGGAANYALCFYDGNGFPRLRVLQASVGPTCGKAPCWKATSFGFTYTDPLLDPDGLKKIVLTAGAVAGKARITVKGKGARLGLALPLAAPVRVQLVHSGGATTCWDATFSTSTRNNGEIFNARSDP